MNEPWLIANLAVLAGVVVLVVAVLVRTIGLAGARREELREALRESVEMRARIDAVTAQLANVERDIRQDLANARSEQGQAGVGLRTELGAAMGRFGEQITTLTHSNEERLDAMRSTVERRLDALRDDNAQRLEQMRTTVDEKLSATLEQRLGESFRLVSERLEQVHRGLGEMHSLAIGVGDLKRVLANVKTRGTWGEVQLAALLAEALAASQYAANVETIPGSGQRVEFAIRLPGRGDDALPCWLPIDAKFPLDEWQRLQEALERADAPAAEFARKTLAERLKAEARTIRAKYVAPPYTTDFAVLFVPTEGLYAEMMARPGLAELLQREHRVTLVGPTNVLALLNSLQLGFRTLAIEQRSHEVWRVLAAVKTEFGKLGEHIAKAKEKVDQASRTLDETGVRSRAISRRLRDVEALPDDDGQRMLVTSASSGDDTAAPSDAG
ncbi:MAG: DNA recombination protein RmuC [Burkholderiales bacterium]|nr:DNA recombination protein RmuC [Burkholderiales bacterium]